MIVALVMLGLFVLLAAGAPVGFAMLISGAAGLYAFGGMRILTGIFDTAPLSAVNTYELVTIPMFLLMAELVLASGIADDLFKAASTWMGRIRGGLGMATAVAGAGFAAICGTSTGSAATLASTTLPAMLKQGYEPKMASGVVAISGTLAILIPPSVGLVVYGLLAEVSIARLLVAGIIPGFLVMLLIMGTVAVLVWLDPTRAPEARPTTWREKLSDLRGVLPMIVLFGVVTSAIYTGFTTPTEASAIGAFGALLIALMRGRGSPSILAGAVMRATFASCMIAMILLGAHVFGYFIALSQIPQQLIAVVGGLDMSPWLIISLVLFGYIILGAFMDQMAILVLTIPIVVPLVASLGYDLVWFGIIMIVVAEIGLITPPIGLNCFVVARYANRPVSEVFQGIFPHFIAHILIIILFMLVPGLILWLPSQM
ncbi:tripartite ATP-independent transporter DctM subunit [Rhodoligotrophos appendicifer]|uniref:TRAP transporter large permease n=1 Tax=Rhodoligotrophos appendicifer TaxID=987056 RepID=UPI0011808044|nr:TRAP transporter large permease subunit [Rhodoligotrophos appendicifer]